MKGLILLVIFPIFFCTTLGYGKGFTVDLVHSKSAQFPYAQQKFKSTVFPNSNAYLVKYSVGSPPLEQFAVLDTGSSLIWLQCHPCTNCYPQSSANFYPYHSSSYKNISCTSQSCNVVPQHSCGGRTNNQCIYEYMYGDPYSFTNGNLATDTLTFGTDTSQVAFPNIIIGCGFNNSLGGIQVPSGIMGLGRGPESLTSQLKNRIEEKFSYCFVPPEMSGSNSKLRFGEDADIPSGVSSVSTPLLSYDDDRYYYLRLEGITVGNNRINNSDPKLGGNIIIDSGTTLTILKPMLYADLEAALRGMVSLNAVREPQGMLRLCYPTESFKRRVGNIEMIFHFNGGADITLGKTNIFVDDGNGLTCFAMVPSDGLVIFGNMAQINFNVQYDVANNIISFAHVDCTSFS